MPNLLSFSLEDDGEVKSIGELKEAFYKVVILLKKELYKKYRKDDRKRIVKPQALIFNPPGYGNTEAVHHIDVYVAIYYHGYYVRIERHTKIFGPHKFELFFQVCKGRHVWLGTATYECNFYSTKEIRRALRDLIMEREYFCSEKSAEEIVEFPTYAEKITIKESRL